jgi:chromosome segregation ATPase
MSDPIEQLHKKIAYLTEQVDRWEDDALRLTKERDALFVLTDRLTAERDDIQRELRKAETECSMLRVECGVIAKERDEARREVCECKCSPPKTPFFGAPQELAEVNGWDCFKDHK